MKQRLTLIDQVEYGPDNDHDYYGASEVGAGESCRQCDGRFHGAIAGKHGVAKCVNAEGDGALVLDHERGDAPNDEGDADAAADPLARG